MRIAAIYDIHGNLPALEAVLEEMRREEVDQVIIGGDVVPGPMPGETFALLEDLHIPVYFLRGNGDLAVLDRMTGRGSRYTIPEQAQEVVNWNAQQLQPRHARLMAGWPRTLRVFLPELGDVLFCHATPQGENEIFTRLTDEGLLLPIFDEAGASLVVCGHTHMPFDRTIGTTRVVNARSVGMPFGEPGADWLLLGADVQFRHTSYDLAKAAEQIRATAYPQAASFAQDVLQPRTEQEMLDLFDRK